MDDHNAKRHCPIFLEYVWATKYSVHNHFSTLLAMTKVNVNLAEVPFHVQNKTKAMTTVLEASGQ